MPRKQRFAAMPGEHHMRCGLSLYVFTGEGFQELEAHEVLLPFAVEISFEIVTVGALDVAGGAHRFGHQIDG